MKNILWHCPGSKYGFMLYLITLGFLFAITGCTIEENLEVTAGDDFTIDFGETVSLNAELVNGSGTDINYEWSINTRPGGSNLTLSNPNNRTISFLPDALGTYSLSVTVSDGSGMMDSDDVNVTVEYAPVELSNITSNTELQDIYDDPEISDYRINSALRVDRTWTIGPGVRIELGEDARIFVENGAKIIAEGEQGNPVVFTGVNNNNGYWSSIVIRSNDLDNVFNYVELRNGGSDKPCLIIEGGNLNMTNSLITGSGNYGLQLGDEGSALSTFSNNTITGNKKSVNCAPAHYHFFNSSNDYSGNEDDYIGGETFLDKVEEDGIWRKVNVPYLIPYGYNTINSDITIEAGTSILGSAESGLVVSAVGSLKAVGTAAEKITFTGVNEVPGYWIGLYIISNSAKNELTHVQVSHGGQAQFNAFGKANLMLQDNAKIIITNSTFSFSDGYGVAARDNTVNLEGFSNNTFKDNFTPIRCTYYQFRFLDEASDYSGNTNDYIESEQQSPLIVDGMWRKLNVPYRLHPGQERIRSSITINAGAVFLGTPESALIVDESGTLTVNGTASEKVIFKGVEDVVGYWRGLSFVTNSNSNKINHMILTNTGQKDIVDISQKVGIGVIGSLNIQNSEISKSGGYGIYVRNGGVLSQSNMTFNNITLDNIKFEE